jgi:regulatory protein
MKANQNISKEEALHWAAAFCSGTERCSSEIAEKLTNRGLANQDIENILQYLIQENYIDENRYTRAFIRDKFRYNQWGRIKIRHMLIQKKISKEVIEASFEVLDDETYSEMIQKLITTKSKGLKAINDYEKKMKIARFLAGKGFEYESFSRLLNLSTESFENE